jgi:hypothetical protein
MNRLTISANRRFLLDENGPFFWLGDTAWELFHRLNFEEAEHYLENRRQKGFTVIQAVVLAEFDGLDVPNAFGERPLLDNDPLQPNPRYFQFVDRIIQLASEKRLWIGLLPTWGDKVELLPHGKGPVIFDAENAFRYGQWIGRRYRDRSNIVWINGGDRSANGANFAIWDALAHGIKSADPNHLMTFHPWGDGQGHSSSEWFHQSDWLDFNLAQSGHWRKESPNYDFVDHDYRLSPTKPCLDGEPRYEDHPVNWKPDELGWFDDYDARQAAYWAMFSGACGHTYGCHPVWQFFAPGRRPVSFARRYWTEALDLPGAAQMTHLKNLFLSRGFVWLEPDQALVTASDASSSAHVRAARDEQLRHGFVYLSSEGTVRVELQRLHGPQFRASWFNPRDGSWQTIRFITQRSDCEFHAPTADRKNDWILVLDSEERIP